MSGWRVIALVGPTAVGKTAVAVALAQVLRAHGELPVAVSADALQVYRGLELLTGVATPVQQARLEHRLVSFLPPDASFSAGQYAQLAHNEIDTLLEQGCLPIVVGGTGLYLRAALAELSFRPPPDPANREALLDELARLGPEALHARLARVAPWAADRIAETDSHRVVRALELHRAGQLTPPDAPSELWTEATRHPTLLVGLVADRERLYANVDARVDAMLAAGVQEEVRAANAAGVSATARQALGFEELLAGDIEAMKRRTRNYVRRQLTWMRKLPGMVAVDLGDRTSEQVAAEIAALWLEGRAPGSSRSGEATMI
jgi:tRNA dimethylallyltransferase